MVQLLPYDQTAKVLIAETTSQLIVITQPPFIASERIKILSTLSSNRSVQNLNGGLAL